MAINVNTNATALYARNNFNKNVTSLASSIEKISSGLRINRSADDPVSLSIANQLNSEALGLGQAVKNANDGISTLQIVDGVLAEVVDILNDIKTKTVQGAQDTLTSGSRNDLQGDIDKLLEELGISIHTASFNGQPLLSGKFINKIFQVGTLPQATIPVSLESSHESDIGFIQTAQLSLSNTGGEVKLSFNNPDTGETLTIRGVNIAFNNSASNGMGALADAINAHEAVTGISAQAIVESNSTNAVKSGATLSSFAINDITIGSITTQASDADGNFVSSINTKTASHGVTASTTSSGQLVLTTSDGRPIEVTGIGTALDDSDADLSTFGFAQIYQEGLYDLDFTDLSEGFAVAFSTNLYIKDAVTTTIDSSLEEKSVLGGGSVLAAGWEAGVAVSGANLSGDIVTTTSSTLLAGSVLASGTIIASGSTLGGAASNASGVTSTDESLLTSGSVLVAGSVIESGTYLPNDITTASGVTSGGTILTGDARLTADLTLTSDMLLLTGSVISSGSTFAAGSFIGGDFTLSGNTTLTEDMTLKANSTLKDTDSVTLISKGSTVGGTATFTATDLTIEKKMTVKAGSTLSSGTELATGSTIGGTTIVSGNHTASENIYLESGSVLATGSLIKSGTTFTNSFLTTLGIIKNGTISNQDYQTSGNNNISNAMTFEKGSVVSTGSTLAANSKSEAGTKITNESTKKLINLSVLTKDDAVTAMEIVDEALANVEEIRSNAASTQNQFEGVVSFLDTTKSNLLSARSKIMDIDFAEEVDNFTRMQLLVQSSSFALVQANAVPANVFNIIQGGGLNSSDFFFSVLNASS